MARHTLKILQQFCKFLKVCLTILWLYTLKSLILDSLPFNIFVNELIISL